MRFGSVLHAGELRTAVLVDDEQVRVLEAGAPTPDDAVRDPQALAEVSSAVGSLVSGAEVTWQQPLRRFNRDVLCTGWNYWDHYEESAGKREGQDPEERPSHPTFFTKAPGSLTGPTADLPFDPEVSGKWDYEAELAVVIGRPGRSIPEDRALEHVVAVLVANDVSQRDLQRAHGGQWLKGKSIDGASPIGPWLTTLDEIDDIQDLHISFDLNGTRLQDAGTRQMAFSVAQVLSELSFGMTLNPGDLVLTGTPSGIGNAREPQIFLGEGDELVTTIDGVGQLRNTMVRADLASYR